MKPAVIGLDANIADVDLIEEAMTKAEEEGEGGDDEEEEEVEGCEHGHGGKGSSQDPRLLAAAAAEKAAMREQLAEALTPPSVADTRNGSNPNGSGATPSEAGMSKHCSPLHQTRLKQSFLELTTQFWWGGQMGMARGALWSRSLS